MRVTPEEIANPRQWLIRLASESDGYLKLVAESGGTGRAAYRLARARCAALGTELCLDDLQASANLLGTMLGRDGTLPIRSLLPGPGSTPPAAERRTPARKSRPRSNRVSA